MLRLPLAVLAALLLSCCTAPSSSGLELPYGSVPAAVFAVDFVADDPTLPTPSVSLTEQFGGLPTVSVEWDATRVVAPQTVRVWTASPDNRSTYVALPERTGVYPGVWLAEGQMLPLDTPIYFAIASSDSPTGPLTAMSPFSDPIRVGE